MAPKNLFVLLLLVVFSAAVFAAVPAVTSNSHPEGEWSNAKNIVLRLSYAGSAGFSYEFDAEDDTIPDTSVDTAESVITLGSKADGVYWFHVRAKSDSGWSDTKHYQIKLDGYGPTRPQTPSATPQPDGSVLVKWGPSEDSVSGLAFYNVFRSTLRFVKEGEFSREFKITDPVAKKVGSKITATEFLDKNFALGEGFRFHYKIQPVDYADNGGSVSQVASVVSLSFCDNTIELVPKLSGTDLNIAISSNLEFKRPKLSIKGPLESQARDLNGALSGKSFSIIYPLAGKPNGDYNISFVAQDSDQDECTVGKVFVYDTTPPAVSILSPPATVELTGLEKFLVKANDGGENPSGIDSVSLIFVGKDGEKTIGTGTKDGDNYSVDWNTLNYDNGRFKVIARAADRGGNRAEDFDTYTIKNTFFAKVGAEQKIADANSEREKTREYLEGLRAKNVNFDSVNACLAAADSNLSYAKDLFAKGQYYELASSSADSARAIYSSIRTKITTKLYSAASYSYNQSQLDVFLGATGLSESARPQAKSLIKSLAPSRKLEILEVKTDSNTYYVANILLGLSKNDRNSISFIVVEPVPKQLADDASDLSSASRLEVLRQDPVISFGPFDMNFNSKKEIIYGLSMQLTKAQADKLISGKVMDYYISPPILLGPSTDVSSLKSSPLFSGIDLPDFKIGSDNILIVAVAGLLVSGILFVILLLIIVAIYYFVIKKKHHRRW